MGDMSSTVVFRWLAAGDAGDLEAFDGLLFRRLHQSGQTILMVTHDDAVAAATERIAETKDGEVVS